MPEDSPAREQERERDRRLVERLVAGENAAWEEFDASFGPRISYAVHRVGVNDGDSGEVCSFVYEALLANDCHRLRQWDGRASLSSYLHRVSRNLAVDFLRHRPRVVFADEEEALRVPDVEAALAHETRALHARLREALLECLFRVPGGPDREMILFHYHLGLPAEDIARLSGRRRNAVDQALHRARRSLREVALQVHPELADYLEEDRRDW